MFDTSGQSSGKFFAAIFTVVTLPFLIIPSYRKFVGGIFKPNEVRKDNPHFGVNLNLNPDNKKLGAPDGEHGHLYIHYKTPTAREPGSIMIGLEPSEPDSPNHSALGHASEKSPVGGYKFDKLAKLAGSENQDIAIPGKYNGMVMKLDTASLEKVVQMKAESMTSEVANKQPCKSYDELKSSFVAKPAISKTNDKSLNEAKKVAKNITEPQQVTEDNLKASKVTRKCSAKKTIL